MSTLCFCVLALAVVAHHRHTPAPRAAKDMALVASPNRRYEVRFSGARSDGKGPGTLWGKISVREVRKGRDRVVRIANGDRGKGNFEAFSLYEDSQAWSPDGLFLAYWDDICTDEPAVPGGVVCYVHEIRFIRLKSVPKCRNELALGRYEFGGWARGRPHTVLEILVNEEGQKVRRSPCNEPAAKTTRSSSHNRQ